MRTQLLAVAMLAACAAAPDAWPSRQVPGSYRLTDGPESWVELELAPGGECTASACDLVGVRRRVSTAGHWRIDGGRVALDFDNDAEFTGEITGRLLTRQLGIRRWEGHVYLVPPRDLALFDAQGPLCEFCFATEDAPLFPYLHSGQDGLPAPAAGALAIEDDVLRLELAARTGDRAAIAALFAMRADGAVAETIDDLLGKTVRVVPQVFLEELAKSDRGEAVRREGARAACLPGLLCCNFDLVDDFAAQTREAEARRVALLTVDEPTLRGLRDACVEVLTADARVQRGASGGDAGR